MRASAHGNILVVDDDPFALQGLRGLLEARFPRLSLSTASSARQALEVVDTCPIATILADVRMPGMDGIELLSRLRARHPSIPVLLMSGHAFDAETADSPSEPANRQVLAFLAKPLDRDQLSAWLNFAIETAKLRHLLSDRPQTAA